MTHRHRSAAQKGQRGVGNDRPTAGTPAVPPSLTGRHAGAVGSADLYWIPLGAGGHFVRFNGRVYEFLVASAQRRPRRDLYHAALIVTIDRDRHAIEIAPSPDANEAARGVVATGAVGSRRLGGVRLFRYEVRCWRNGLIPDLRYAVGGGRRVADGAIGAQRVLDVLAGVPTPVWGRDELGAGEMWNSNSMIAWVLSRAGIAVADLHPPRGGRAPGWNAGITVAARRAFSPAKHGGRGDRKSAGVAAARGSRRGSNSTHGREPVNRAAEPNPSNLRLPGHVGVCSPPSFRST